MTRKELINGIAAKLEQDYGRSVPKTTLSLVIDEVFIQLGDSLENQGRVRVPQFGTFSTRIRPARTARNPKTGEPVELPRRRTVAFKPSGSWKTRLSV